MIHVLGPALILFGCVSATAAVALGCSTRVDPTGAWTRRATAGAAIGLVAAVVTLAFAQVTSNVELAYVADNVRPDAPFLYRFAGVWAGMDGSLLLWSAGFAGLAWLFARRRGTDQPSRPIDAAWVLSGLAAAYGLLDLALANPFRLSTAPMPVGVGMAPILEHPAMLVHPPLVYAGLIATIAVAAISPSDTGWRRALWGAWAILLVGMGLGAAWSYTEAGWGGYWAWDPVENVSLIPWLCLTGALHAPGLTGALHAPGLTGALHAPGATGPRHQPTRIARYWTGAGAALALLGVVVTRSGATASIHAFAKDSKVGWGVAAIALIGVIALGIPARRDPGRSTAAINSPVTRTGRGRTTAMAALGAAAFIVTVGTLRPLVDTIQGGAGVIVQPSYYVRLLGPLAAVAIIGLIAMSSWRAIRGSAMGRAATIAVSSDAPDATGGDTSAHEPSIIVAPRTVAAAGMAGAVAFTVLGALAGATSMVSLVGLGLAGTAIGTTVLAWRRHTFGRVAALGHVGLCVMLAGVAGAASSRSDAVTVAVGKTVTIAGEPFGLRSLDIVDDGRTSTISATIDQLDDDERFTPRLVSVPARRAVLAEVDISPGISDTHVAIRRATDDQRALIEVTIVPLAFLMWSGGALLLGTAAVALVGQKRPDRSIGSGSGNGRFRRRLLGRWPAKTAA